jgi:RNA polymerase sigma-70 factor (ECF subfamily)
MMTRPVSRCGGRWNKAGPAAVSWGEVSSSNEVMDVTIEQAVPDGAATYSQEAAGYRPLLFSAAYQMTHNSADAEDLVQETYLKAHQNCASFQGTYLRGWLSRILKNTFINAYHSRKRHPEVLGLDGDETPPGALTPSAGRDPAEEVLARLVDEGLQSALRSLPSANLKVVLLADVEGYSYKEIAHLTGSPIGTVMSRLHRGRQALKNALSESGFPTR